MKIKIITTLCLIMLPASILNLTAKRATAGINSLEWHNIIFTKTPVLTISKEVNKKQYEGTIREISAYNVGDINQCYGNPCQSANGENICLAVASNYSRCAANFVPFGTRLLIEHYGECLVTDRMNSRYPQRVDIAMRLDEKERALKFGIQKRKVSIIK